MFPDLRIPRVPGSYEEVTDPFEGRWSSRSAQTVGTILALGKTDQGCPGVIRARFQSGHRFTLVSGGEYVITAKSSARNISLRDPDTKIEYPLGETQEFPAGQHLILTVNKPRVVGWVSLTIRKV